MRSKQTESRLLRNNLICTWSARGRSDIWVLAYQCNGYYTICAKTDSGAVPWKSYAWNPCLPFEGRGYHTSMDTCVWPGPAKTIKSRLQRHPKPWFLMLRILKALPQNINRDRFRTRWARTVWGWAPSSWALGGHLRTELRTFKMPEQEGLLLALRVLWGSAVQRKDAAMYQQLW